VKPKNILLILADQQRHDTIAAAGYGHMHTPNLDRLAATGTVFTQACSTNPVCMPARHDLLTGLPGKAHGYYGNFEHPMPPFAAPTIPGLLAKHGYHTAAIGKCHHNPVRAPHGFAELQLMEELPQCRELDQYAEHLAAAGYGGVQNLHGVRPLLYHFPQCAQMPAALHGSNFVADRTVEFLSQKRREPFFLFCGFIHPHPPWDLPPSALEPYLKQTLPKPLPRSRREHNPASEWFGDFDSEAEKRKIRAAYFASITLVDQAVGRILDALKSSGQWDDTLIIYTSDHGEMLQDKGYYSKELPYASSVRIPLIVKFPAGDPALADFSPGSFCHDTVDLFDLMPTVLETAHVERPRDQYLPPGASLRQAKVRRRDIQISSFHNDLYYRWVMAQNCDYKFVYYYNGGKEELFDLKNDPGELVNLAAEQLPAAALPLKEAVIDWEEKWGPAGCVSGRKLAATPYQVRDIAFGGKFPRWLNGQFQRFNEVTPQERQKRFLKEAKLAVPAGPGDRVPAEFRREFEAALERLGKT